MITKKTNKSNNEITLILLLLDSFYLVKSKYPQDLVKVTLESLTKFVFLLNYFLGVFLPRVVDGVVFKSNCYSYLCFNISLSLKSQRFFLLSNAKNRPFSSISKVFKSNVWLERELLEFNSIQIDKSLDTRRLLTDYFFIKQTPEPYCSKEIFYNVYLDDFFTF